VQQWKFQLEDLNVDGRIMNFGKRIREHVTWIAMTVKVRWRYIL